MLADRATLVLFGTALLALALLHRRRRRGPATTASIERGSCAVCGCAHYLDAASNTLRCPRCETRAAKDGAEGVTALDDQGSEVRFQRAAFDPGLLEALREEVDWAQHDDLLPDGRVVLQPRLIAYQAADPSLVYSYEGLTTPLNPAPFTPHVALIKAKVEKLTGESYNSVHRNLYRTGGDHVSWHTDEDVELYGPTPHIASVSFGAARDFVLRRMGGEPYAADWQPVHPPEMVRYALGGGALLVMSGRTQHHFEHCVLKQLAPPSDASCGAARINMTFRSVVGA